MKVERELEFQSGIEVSLSVLATFFRDAGERERERGGVGRGRENAEHIFLATASRAGFHACVLSSTSALGQRLWTFGFAGDSERGGKDFFSLPRLFKVADARLSLCYFF